MSWLLQVKTLSDLEKGSVIGGVCYNLADPLAEVVDIIKKCSSNKVFVNVDHVDAETATTLLNAGTKALVVNLQTFNELVELNIPDDRLVVRDSSDSGELVKNGKIGGVATTKIEEHKQLAEIATSALSTIGYLVPVFYLASSEADLVNVFLNQLTSDRPDQLYTTVVTSPRHRVLGVCYSSKESITEAIKTRTGVYQSRRRGLWFKGASSGAIQRLISIAADCDSDALEFVVDQTEPGFCHNNRMSCFGLGELTGLDKLEATVSSRLNNAPEGSYTQRLFKETGLLEAKIKEEADELCEATTREEVAWEAADLLYFVSVKLAQHGMSFKDVEADLDRKSSKITRRKGDAKPQYLPNNKKAKIETAEQVLSTKPVTSSKPPKISMNVVNESNAQEVTNALRRPAQSSNAFELAKPIVEEVRKRGDAALIEFTAKFEKAQLTSPVLNAPFPAELMQISPELKSSIDLACSNVEKFHSAQLLEPLHVETVKGVKCSRFSRAISRVGLYVPGGTAILPSTAIHLGVPAQVAGCEDIILATPPRQDGTPSPEVTYVAHKIGAKQIVLAGGAQAVAAMAYGTESVTKVNKILGPGNQFVTAAKMICSTDVNAQVSIDMPAGPSEVLVVADKSANKKFVVSDLLSQAEHGADSQVILVSIGWDDQDLAELQEILHRQATTLPRCEVVRKSIAHSSVINVSSVEKALEMSNQYAPEHLILQIKNASEYVRLVKNAGSVFVGTFSPESCGDYTSGTNHTLPTYGYANQYSGVNTDTYLKYITSQEVSAEGIRQIGPATIIIAEREGLQGHANAVKVRLDELEK